MDNQTERSEQPLKDTLNEDLQSIKQEARSAGGELADKAREKAEAGKEQAANTLNQLSDAIDEMASSISEDDKLGLAGYVHDASSRLAALSTRLQQASVDELVEDAKQLARRQPAAFLLGSVALGFGLSRFVKASTHHASAQSQMDAGHSEPSAGFADPAGSYPGSAGRYTSQATEDNSPTPWQ